MAKVLATEIRIGHLLEWEKRIWRVIKCYHVHVGGRGGAFMQVEMKDIQTGYLLPNTDVQVVFYNDQPIGVELPPSVVLTVTETDPNIRNATVTTSFKPRRSSTPARKSR